MTRNKTKVIGLTGGIATGKTTVSEFLKKNGYVVIDADNIAKAVVEKNYEVYDEILSLFGESILTNDNKINREKLGEIIFKNQDLRNQLNNIVHPKVYEIIRNKIRSYKEEKKDIIFVDIPLLVEVKAQLKKENIIFDEVWLIYANKERQLSRLMNRNKYTKNQAQNRINAQMDIDEKIKYCDKIINNSFDIENTKEQVRKLLNIT